MMIMVFRLLAVASLLVETVALDNGLALTPVMGAHLGLTLACLVTPPSLTPRCLPAVHARLEHLGPLSLLWRWQGCRAW